MSRIDQVDPHCPGIQEGIILYIRSDKSITAFRHRIQQHVSTGPAPYRNSADRSPCILQTETIGIQGRPDKGGKLRTCLKALYRPNAANPARAPLRVQAILMKKLRLSQAQLFSQGIIYTPLVCAQTAAI